MARRIISIIILAVIAAALLVGCAKGEDPAPDPAEVTLTVMSYNIRTIALDADKNGPDYWYNRREALVAHIKAHDPDIIGMQEVLSGPNEIFQDKYLAKHLTDYDFVGETRETLEAFTERVPVFYKKDKFELIETKTFWISETPDVPSRSWDSSTNRICTYAILKHKESGKIIQFFNTHLDHKGSTARKKGAEMLSERVSASEYPAILTGDFNFDEKSSNYPIITEKLDDTKYIAETSLKYGTFHGYKDTDISEKSPIDFCFVKKDCFIVHRYEVLHEKYDGKFTSDHYAVKVQLTLK